MQLTLAFWNLEESPNKAVGLDPPKYVGPFAGRYDVSFVLSAGSNGNGSPQEFIGKVREATRRQCGITLEASAIDSGCGRFLSCFVQSRPITGFVKEIHLQKLSPLNGSTRDAAGNPVVAALAAWDKETSRVHDLRVGACYGAGMVQQFEPLFQKQRVLLATSGRCINYSQYQLLNVATAAEEGDSAQLIVTMNL